MLLEVGKSAEKCVVMEEEKEERICVEARGHPFNRGEERTRACDQALLLSSEQCCLLVDKGELQQPAPVQQHARHRLLASQESVRARLSQCISAGHKGEG